MTVQHSTNRFCSTFMCGIHGGEKDMCVCVCVLCNIVYSQTHVHRGPHQHHGRPQRVVTETYKTINYSRAYC